jgi:hypothetical protein
MWNLGYSGLGGMAYVYDSGTRHQHPALRERFIGNRFGLRQGWRSFKGNTLPIDTDGEHGTHVAGTIVGLQRSNNDTIGVAPAGYFISNDIIPSGGNTQQLVQAFQFALNPDGNTQTSWDVPHVINNSWGFEANAGACNLLNGTWGALEAAGIGNIFSAGNSGPGASTVGGYGAVAVDSLRNFAVGNLNAANAAFPINSSSSRGPTICASGQLGIKPEVSAPGTNVRSSVGETGYAQFTGTSMASPHVSGAYLLLREAFPTASPRQLLNSMYQTAVDLGTPGEDNEYGRGIIDVQAAYNFLAQSFTPIPPNSSRRDLAIVGLQNRLDGEILCEDVGRVLTENVIVRNMGKDTVSAFDIDFGFGSFTGSSNWTGSLRPNQQVVVAVQVPAQTSAAMTMPELLFRVRATGTPDRDTVNNRWAVRLRRQDGSMPFGNINNGQHQNFANPAIFENQWTINNPGGDNFTWEQHVVQGLPGTASAMKVRMSNYAPGSGQLDELISPYFIPVGTSGNVDLHFRLAYRTRAGANGDSLFVFISEDCQNWTRVFASGGTEMVTYPAGTEPTSAAHWRMIRVPQVIPVFRKVAIKFVTRNGFGGNLYLTNISYGDVPLGLYEDQAPGFSIYPNPTDSYLTVALEEASVNRLLRITDQSGREVYRRNLQQGETQTQLDLTHLAAGFYLVHVDGNGGTSVQKLVKTTR